MAYGLISNVRLPRGTSTPVRVAAADSRNSPGPPEIGTGVAWTISFFQRMFREIWMPQTCSASPGRKRRDLNGSCASTVHPPSKRPTRESQIGFQSMFGLPSSVIW